MNQRAGLVEVLREAIDREERALARLRSVPVAWIQDMRGSRSKNLKDEMIADTEERIARKRAIIKVCELG
jgi:hypothetical protein